MAGSKSIITGYAPFIEVKYTLLCNNLQQNWCGGSRLQPKFSRFFAGIFSMCKASFTGARSAELIVVRRN